ncbi:hypothetical protein [Streptomyces tsukubensis]|nr:hypothetical protein [Streptomyces tsukubensis]QFR94201.1 hypothetical protein GBW32_15485 [Streptomyces tsukubensis]
MTGRRVPHPRPIRNPEARGRPAGLAEALLAGAFVLAVLMNLTRSVVEPGGVLWGAARVVVAVLFAAGLVWFAGARARRATQARGPLEARQARQPWEARQAREAWQPRQSRETRSGRSHVRPTA